MKKILSAAVVMAMAAALSVSAFASTTVADNGSDIKFDVPKANTTPVMDGVINPGEYSEIATAEADWCIGTPNDDWDEAAWNLAKTAKVYMSWDENYIYYASTFTAPFGFYCPWEDEPGSIWYSGCMQMAYSSLEDHEDATSNHWEDGVGKAENGNKVYISYGTPEGYDQTDEETLAGLFDFTINGNDVVFEHRVPYQAFAPGAFAEGQQYGMCAVYSIGQDQDYLHVQLSGGVSGGKDQSMNAVITLKPAPVVETEAPETEAPAPETEAPAPETEAPAPVAETAAPVAETAAPVAEAAPAAAAPAAQTGDVAAVVVLAAVAAVGTAVVVSKKH